jgi:hypothetical protein
MKFTGILFFQQDINILSKHQGYVCVVVAAVGGSFVIHEISFMTCYGTPTFPCPVPHG